MYILRILPEAEEELLTLDRTIAQRLISRLQWLAENIESVRLISLKGELSGLYKFRVGDYRVIYQILFQEKVIVIHQIGHRKEIYKR